MKARTHYRSSAGVVAKALLMITATEPTSRGFVAANNSGIEFTEILATLDFVRALLTHLSTLTPSIDVGDYMIADDFHRHNTLFREII